MKVKPIHYLFVSQIHKHFFQHEYFIMIPISRLASLSITTLTVLLVMSLPSDCSASLTFSFTGTTDDRFAVGANPPGVPGTGSIRYSQIGTDANAHPDVGEYDIMVNSFDLTIGQSSLQFQDVEALLTIKDNAGCDCFFINIPFVGSISDESFTHLIVNIQNEFGPDAFTMFDNDSFPMQLTIPADSSQTVFDFRNVLDSAPGTSLTGRLILDRESISLSAVPEPSGCVVLAALLSFAILRTRKRAAFG